MGRPDPHAPATGFSLVELLVVIATIVLLAGMLVPTVGVVRDQARRIACAGNMRQLTLATIVYASDNDGLLPEAGNNVNHGFFGSGPPPVWGVISAYLDEGNVGIAKVMYCPAKPAASTLAYSFHAGQARDYPRSILWLTALASRLNLAGGQPSMWGDHLVAGAPNGANNFNYTAHCNHKLRNLTAYTGVPAGGNLSFCDGSVRWVPYVPGGSDGADPGFFNGQFGYPFLFANTCILIRTDVPYTLYLGPPAVCIGSRGFAKAQIY